MKERLAAAFAKLKEKLSNATSEGSVKKLYVTAIVIAAVLIIITTVCGAYLGDYYRADNEAIAEVVGQASSIEIYELRDGVTVFEPAWQSEVGLIFYPGGKVEARAYEPLMVALASRGIVAVLCEMPFNLAVFNVNAAEGIPEMLPEVDSWYIGGHSLGGSMAASYLASNKSKIDGLVLLGSYSTEDVTDSRVISIYGSEDRVMNREKYDSYKGNLPTDLSELVIEGGNHAYFGMYGEQEGDGEAKITPDAQITLTATKIAEFILKAN